ncbi:MAG: hypothetical protein PHU21_10990 [Elusimicrobia bacterium]|nr:hypothetical protein [Elusimicrobiota bacterium]
MSPKTLRLCLLAALLLAAAPAAVPSRAATTRPGAEGVSEARISGQVGSDLAVPKVQLQIPVVDLTLAPALQTPVLAPKVAPLALPAPAPGLTAAALPAPAVQALEGVKTEAAPAAPAQAEAPARDEEGLTQAGRAVFDQAQASPERDAAPVPARSFSFGRWLGGLLKRGDQVPPWPGRSGDRVRAGGRAFTLGPRLGEGNSSVVYRAEGGRNGYAVKLIHPEFKDIPYYGAEAEALKVLARTDIPHARLVAQSADGLVVVKELVPGETGAALLARGALSAHSQDNLAEFAARLLDIGYTGDLAPGNLVWDHWQSAWTLVDGGGFRMAAPRETLKQLLEGGFFKPGGADPARFLAAVRGRLGPGSQAWAKVLADAPAEPALAPAFAALTAADRAAPAAPRLEFSPGPASASLDDSWLPPREARRRLGFDPELVKDRFNLHADDPGKLNTAVRELRLPDGRRLVSKRSSAEVIRNELLLRRVVRRWFGRYFDAPRSLAYPLGGGEALMVMERSPGGRSYVDTRLSLPQRAALAVLVHSFGVGDVNEGNVLYEDGGRVALIDFEQALSRHRPVTSRIPDEGIAAEMPWLSRRGLNRAEDYFPAAAAWRELLARPETQAELRGMMLASGFKADEVPGVLSVVQANAARLEWVIQADVEFVNQFARRAAD